LTKGEGAAVNVQKEAGSDPEQDSADLFDYALIRDYLAYAAGAVRRRKWLVAAVLAGCIGLAVAALAVLPKTWKVEAGILAQRNAVIAALGNPGRSMPSEADAPTRAASETILSRDNLVALVKQTALVDRWDASRAPLLRLKDFVVRAVGKAPTEEDKLDMLVAVLEKKLTVTTGEGTVTIALEWPDGQMCYQLVEAAQQNFLEARHVSEISTIAEAISILEGHAAAVRDVIQQEMEELQQLREARSETKPRAAPAPIRIARAPQVDQDLLQLRLMLAAKRKAIGDLEDFRHRRLAELQAELAKERAVYADQHPVVLNLKDSIDALAIESPQLAALRKEEQSLRNELLRRGVKNPDADGGREAPLPRENEPIVARKLPPAPTQGDADPVIAYAQSRIQFDSQKYNNLLDRIDSARIELDTARAAFKYRYSVIRPPQVPRKPIKPNAALVIGAGIAFGLALGILAAILAELRAGRLVEKWQAERILGLPIVSDMEAP
jgi:uncharacterized protein involved in exopolysaccharide biosynthesis